MLKKNLKKKNIYLIRLEKTYNCCKNCKKKNRLN